MHQRFVAIAAACVSASSILWACGGSEVAPPADAGSDVLPKVRDAAPRPDTAPPPYVPVGTRCVRGPDAGVPPQFIASVVDSGASDAATEGGTEGGVAQNPTLPQVVAAKNLVDALPIFVPITFDSDDLRPEIEDFVASFGCTSWWRAVASDYGIGDAITGDPVHLSEVAPTKISDSEIQAWLRKKIGDPTFPQPTANTVYSIYYPSGSQVQTTWGRSCYTFGAYHSYFYFKNQWVAYAVMPRCADISALTAVSSHEFIEAATDSAPGGFQSVGERDVAWSLFGGSEVGDMCEHTSNANFQPTDYPFLVQRSWSNKSAFFGHDPCLPSDSPWWFVAAPVLSDTVNVNYYGQSIPALGLKLASGAKATVDLKMISDGPTTGWNVSAQDLSQWTVGQTLLKFSFDKTSGVEGDVIKMTIARVGTNQNFGAEPFFIRSSTGSAEHLWFGVVGD